MKLLILFYVAGFILGSLGLIEWIVGRLVKLWLAGFFAGLVACVLSIFFAGALKVRRMIAR